MYVSAQRFTICSTLAHWSIASTLCTRAWRGETLSGVRQRESTPVRKLAASMPALKQVVVVVVVREVEMRVRQRHSSGRLAEAGRNTGQPEA